MSADPSRGRDDHVSRVSMLGLGLVLLSQFSMQFGAGAATFLFPIVGPTGTVALRLALSALIIVVVLRPQLRGLSRQAWAAAVFLGLALAAMNSLIYLSFERIPLGTAVTIEIIGPLLLTVVLSRKLSSWLLAACAFAGVWLVSGAPFPFAGTVTTPLDAIGVLLALGAGLSWAAYIIFTRKTAMQFRGADGLAVALIIASIVVVPVSLFTLPDPAELWSLRVILIGLAVAVLSSALPYGLEQLATRRLPTASFAMLMSLSPVIATLVGFVMLGQSLSPPELIGVALVVAATAVAMRPERPSP